MATGVGFHSDFTGAENIRASLLYSGLPGKEIEATIDDIVDFCELGDFLHQPVKTYSLGMRSRLQFAAATAIKPDILIIDEMLGAGDAYFTIKSNERLRKLTSSGCTVLLVTHSMSHVIQLCQRAIWINHGRILKEGEPRDVVGAYEAYCATRQGDRVECAIDQGDRTTGAGRWGAAFAARGWDGSVSLAQSGRREDRELCVIAKRRPQP